MSRQEIEFKHNDEFNRKMKIAICLTKHLRDKKDARLAIKWLNRVVNVRSSLMDANRNRNAFLSYFIRILRDSILSDSFQVEEDAMYDLADSIIDEPLDYSDEYPGVSAKIRKNTSKEIKNEFHCKWSADYRTYSAIKSIPGKGALVYMAVSKEPGIKNWVLPSDKNHAK